MNEHPVNILLAAGDLPLNILEPKSGTIMHDSPILSDL